MLLQSIFDVDVIRDPKLCSIVAYGLVNAKSVKSTQFLCDDEPIPLLPFQVLFSYIDVERIFGIQKEEFFRKIDKLSAKMNVIIEQKEQYVIIKFLEFDTNVTSLNFIPEQLEGERITLSQWLEYDIQTFFPAKSEKYLENTKMTVNKFIDFIGDKTLSSITRRDYEKFVHSLRESGKLSLISINDYTRILKAFIRRAVKKEYIKTDPFERMKQVPEPTKEKIIWEREEVSALWQSQHLTKWMENSAKLALLTGMRRGEVANLLWVNVDHEERNITIKSTEVHTTKFNKKRTFPMNDDLVKLLKDIILENKITGIESKYVICDEKGININGDRLQKKLRKITEEVKMREGLCFHGFRKTFATGLRRKGVPQSVIAYLLGHSDERVTNRYLGTPSDDMISAIQQIKLSDFE